MSLTLRRELASEYRQVEELTREAFWNHFQPGADEHYLTHVMRSHADYIPELSLVAEMDGELVGSIVYTKSKITRSNGEAVNTATFGPIAVSPTRQKQGIGRQLILRTARLARDLGYAAIVIYGDPAYYGRVGFHSGERHDLRNEENHFAAALQVLPLQHGVDLSGVFSESPVFASIDAEALAEYETTFPAKEKVEGNESQLRFLVLRTLSWPATEMEL